MHRHCSLWCRSDGASARRTELLLIFRRTASGTGGPGLPSAGIRPGGGGGLRIPPPRKENKSKKRRGCAEGPSCWPIVSVRVESNRNVLIRDGQCAPSSPLGQGIPQAVGCESVVLHFALILLLAGCGRGLVRAALPRCSPHRHRRVLESCWAAPRRCLGGAAAEKTELALLHTAGSELCAGSLSTDKGFPLNAHFSRIRIGNKEVRALPPVSPVALSENHVRFFVLIHTLHS